MEIEYSIIYTLYYTLERQYKGINYLKNQQIRCIQVITIVFYNFKKSNHEI